MLKSFRKLFFFLNLELRFTVLVGEINLHYI